MNPFTNLFTRFLAPTEKRVAITFDNFPDGISDSSTTSWRFLEYVKLAYKKNPIVYACIREIYTASKSVKLVIKRDNEIIPESEVPAELKPIQQLITMPAQGSTMRSFIEMWCLHMNIAGEAFALLRGFGVRQGLNGEEFKASPEMVLLRPDQVRIVKDKYGFIEKYEYYPTSETFLPEEIIYTRYPDPQNMTGSYSPVGAAAEVIDAHTNSITWNRNVLARGGIPAILFFIKGLVSLKKTKRQEMIDEYQSQYGGAKNAGRPMFLPGESVEAQPMSQTAKDVDWLLGKQDMQRDICAVFGVPSNLVGDPAASTYNNVAEARKSLYLEKVLPDLQAFADALTNTIASKKPGIEIGLSYSHIDVMQEDADALYTRLSLASWLTENEKRIASGFDERPEGNIILTPFNLVPLGTDVIGATTASAGAIEKQSTAVDDKKISLYPINAKSRYKTEMSRTSAFNRINKMRIPFERQYIEIFGKYAHEQLNLVVDSLDGRYSQADKREKRAFVGDLFEYTDQEALYAEAFSDLAVNLTVKFGQAALNELRLQGVIFDINRPSIQNWIAENLSSRSRLINDTTANQMQAVINQGVAENQSTLEIKQRLQERFTDLTPARARAIAQTEINRASSRATYEGYQQSDMTFRKEWISSRDASVRDAHAELDGQVVEFDEDFISMAGGMGLFPGDMGTAADDINCRCTFAVLDEGEAKI